MTHKKFQGFVRVQGGRILDHDGNPVLLRGMGLGNWMVPEGYMWRLSPGCESATEIEALIESLVGPDSANNFWKDFHSCYVNRADIEQIASEGMDHVRLPMHWRLLMEADGTIRPEGFELIDHLILWCRDNGLWVLLDLHAAPGGQTGTNIDDSPGRPELFMDERNLEMTEALWVEIATRYRDETVVLGYDLLNEPLPNEWQDRYPNELIGLYKSLTNAIRAVDTNHLLMYEGSHWATNWSIFTEVWDENSVLQFHKYWSPPDHPTIQQFIDVGESLGLPIYMGEGGENNTDWFATVFGLYEDLNIGWCFWPWKKIDTKTSPCSIEAPPGWSDIVAFANNNGPKPSLSQALETLQGLISAMKFDRCTYRPEIANALLRRAPISLPATAFGFRGQGISYETTSATPLSGFRSDDAVTIGLGDSTEMPKFDHDDGTKDADLVVHLAADEWIVYDIEAQAEQLWEIVLQTESGSQIPSITLDGLSLQVSALGEQWVASTTSKVALGRHSLRIIAGHAGLACIRVEISTPLVSPGQHVEE